MLSARDRKKARENGVNIYKRLNISVPLGYYRIPIKVVDYKGNVSKSFIEGEAVRAE